MLHNLKKEVHDTLDPKGTGARNQAVNAFIIGVIILNVVAVILETVHSVFLKYERAFLIFDWVSVAIFSVEYVLRVWSCNAGHQYPGRFKGRLRYIFSFDGLVDLLAILPFYIHFAAGFDFRFVRILRLFRLMRLFKLARYFHSTKLMVEVLDEKKDELLISLSIMIVMMVFSSCLMYFIEHEAQPDKFGSIPESMWWSVIALTTTGYGDVVPITNMGKVLASFIAVLGIGLFALPAGILASGFSEVIQRHRHKKHHCPYCGEKLD